MNKNSSCGKILTGSENGGGDFIIKKSNPRSKYFAVEDERDWIFWIFNYIYIDKVIKYIAVQYWMIH